MSDTIQYRFLVRGGAQAPVEALNEVPLRRELIVETDTRRMKIGDGVTPYNGLPYIVGRVRGVIGFGASNGASAVSVGVKRVIRVTEATEIHGWVLSADAAGDAVIGLWASSSYPPTEADSITGSTPPRLVGQSNAAGDVAGWSASIPADTWLAFAVMAGTDVTGLDLTLKTTRDA